MNILHIIPTLGVGGTERQLVNLLPRIDRVRFRQTVCFYTPSETLETPLREAGIPVIFFDKFSMSAWSFFRRMRRVIHEVGPDVIHTWLYSANFWGRLAGISCGVRRLVASNRSMAIPTSSPVVLYERILAPYTTRLANSRAVAASLERRYGLPAAGIKVIYNAVDPPAIPPANARAAVRAELGLPEGQMLILMAGRQTPEKNHAMFLRAARRVGRRRSDVTFVVLGHLFRPGEMHALVDTMEAALYVRIVNQREDMPRWLAASDIFCLTSNAEGLPNVVLEAMATGLPVVCTDFESAREVIPDDRTGVIVPRDDDAALAAAVLTLLADAERRRSLGAAAREYVRVHFGWDRLVRDMESLYDGLA